MGRVKGVIVPAAISAAVALSATFLVRGADDSDSASAIASEAPAGAIGSSDGPAAATLQGQEQEDQSRPSAAEMPTLGVQFHGTWAHYDERKRDAILDKIVESGSSWVRLDLGWAMIEPTRGTYDMAWAVPLIDDVLADLDSRGLKVLVMFWRTPAWANSNAGSVYYTPDDPADYADAIGWAAQRWGQQIDAWEVWNEPNLHAYYRGTDPEAYAGLLCAAYDQLKVDDPRSPVLFGGLLFSDATWLESALDAGATGCFDVVGLHYYAGLPVDEPPALTDDGDGGSLQTLTRLREIMADHHDVRPIWITEFGWSVHKNWDGVEPWRRGVTAAQQAAYAEKVLDLFAEHFPYVQKAFWYKDVANDHSNDVHQEGFGMLDKNLQPRPVFDVFKRLYADG